MTPEHKLMNEIRLWCGEHNLLAFRTNVGTLMTKDGKFLNTGLPKGFSDMIVCDDKGHTIFVETKIKPRKPTTEQLQFLSTMRKRGFHAFVCYSLEEFITNINKGA